jgi:hypothetical protein
MCLLLQFDGNVSCSQASPDIPGPSLRRRCNRGKFISAARLKVMRVAAGLSGREMTRDTSLLIIACCLALSFCQHPLRLRLFA